MITVTLSDQQREVTLRALAELAAGRPTWDGMMRGIAWPAGG